MEKKGYKDPQMYKTMADASNMPSDHPMEWQGNFCCGKWYPLDFDVVEAKLSNAEIAVESLQQEINLDSNDADTQERRKRKFTGKGFVVLNSQNMAYEVATRAELSTVRSCGKTCCPCFCNPRDLWEIERATEPSDVYWENMRVYPLERFCRQFFCLYCIHCLDCSNLWHHLVC
jgi:hypothetical protein